MHVIQCVHSVCSSQKVIEWLHRIYACYTMCPQCLQFTESDWMTSPYVCMLYNVSTVPAVHRKWLNDFTGYMHVIQCVHSACSSQKVTEWLLQMYVCYTGYPQCLQFTEGDWMTSPDICMLYKVSAVSAVHRKWLNDFTRYMHVIQGVHSVCSSQKVTEGLPQIYACNTGCPRSATSLQFTESDWLPQVYVCDTVCPHSASSSRYTRIWMYDFRMLYSVSEKFYKVK